MSHYARVINGIVEEVIVADQSVIDAGLFGDPEQWIQTSYNTYGGVHKIGNTPLRKNFASPGFTYDLELDAFYAPQPFPSWTLDTATCLWNPPVPYPNDGKYYIWDESTVNWKEAEL
jgi:hypothetical protein